MGLVIVFLPAYFPAHPSPEWRIYDALPDPIGWALVMWGMVGLARHLEVDLARWLGWAALVVSLPLWLPQLNHLLIPEYNPAIDISFQWFLSLPQMLFSLALARTIGRAGQEHSPRDRYVAGRFGVLTWAFAGCIVLPVLAYGGGVEGLVTPSAWLIAIANLTFIWFLFRVHRREWLGGPGPLEIHPRPRVTEP